MKTTIHILFACLLSFALKAQHESTLYFMHSLPQSTHYNPSRVMNHKVAIVLPGLSGAYFLASNDGFAFQDAVSVEKGIATVSLERLTQALKPQNTARFQLNYELFGLYIRKDSLSINFHIGDRFAGTFVYPKSLFEFIYKGNGHPDFLGKSIQLNPQAHVIHYREASLGFTRSLMANKLHVGAAAKLLFGLGYMDASSPLINLTSSSADNYPITISASGSVLTSGIYSLLDDPDDGALVDYIKRTTNPGFAFDFGATYQLTDKLLLEANVLNLGKIFWKTDLRKYEMATNQTSYTFEGIDILNLVKDGEQQEALNQLLDSAKSILSLENVAEGRDVASFSTGIPMQMQVGARYELAKHLYAGGLFSVRSYNGDALPSFSAAMVKEFGGICTMALSYSATTRSANNVGFGFSLNTPLQIHVVSDNALSALVSPASAKYFNLRVGVNLLFGYAEKIKKERKAQKNDNLPKDKPEEPASGG